MHAFLAGLLLALEGTAVAGAASPVSCPTAAQVDAELERLGESGVVDRLGESDVSVAGGTMRIVLRDRTGTTLGVREVAAPSECAKRISLAAVLLAAWAKTWNETAFAPAVHAEVAESARARRDVEVGLAVGAAADGDGHAPAGGLLARVQLDHGLSTVVAADLEGQRQIPVGPGAATYLGLRLGCGLAVRAQRGLVWTELAVLPQVTRLSVEGKNLMTPRTATLWGAAVEARGRIGLGWGRLAPFLSLAVDRTLVQERLTLDDTTDSAHLPAWDVAVQMGVSWHFVSPG